jgi:hypothetical protein
MFPESFPHLGHGVVDPGPVVFGTDGHLPRLAGWFKTRPSEPEETHRAIYLDVPEEIQSRHIEIA